MKSTLQLLLLLLPFYANGQKVEGVTTTEKTPWHSEKKLKLAKEIREKAPAVEIHVDRPLQKMIGFGGCFNELGWEALQLLPVEKQQVIFDQLFLPANANFQYNRFPVGASDYSSGFYSLNEEKDDFGMNHFSIERDKQCLIPYIRQAQQRNGQMRFFASPWCPPSWMKTNENYASVSSDKYNTLSSEKQSVTTTTGFKMLSGYLEAYALYFSLFLDAYAAEGIPVNDLHVQNEVIAEQIFPSCIWSPRDLGLFIGSYLGPRFEKAGHKTNIWLGTLNVPDPNYVRTVMETPEAARYITGVGYQWDGKKSIGQTHRDYPSLQLVQTENECGNGENNWSSAIKTWNLIKHYINNGAAAYTYWNFILQTPGVSHWGWVQNSMVTINKDTKEVVYNPEFYVMKHLSHFVQPGASFIPVSRPDEMLAFKNPDGSLVIVAGNDSEEDKPYSLKINNKVVPVNLKSGSFSTFRITDWE